MTFRHRAGVRPYTSPCGFAESCVFGKQSLGPIRCGPPPLRQRVPSRTRGRPFSRSYGAGVPSSLTMVPPIASVCSTRPPVSVLVRAPASLPRGFSRGRGLCGFGLRLRLASRASRGAGFHAPRPTRFHGGVQNPARIPFPVAPSVTTVRRRYRNVRLLRIGYACRPRLSSRLTLGGLALPRNPWAYGGGVSRAALATHASILAPARSTEGRPLRFAPRGTLPYRGDGNPSPPAASAPCLAPCIVGARPLDQ